MHTHAPIHFLHQLNPVSKVRISSFTPFQLLLPPPSAFSFIFLCLLFQKSCNHGGNILFCMFVLTTPPRSNPRSLRNKRCHARPSNSPCTVYMYVWTSKRPEGRKESNKKERSPYTCSQAVHISCPKKTRCEACFACWRWFA